MFTASPLYIEELFRRLITPPKASFACYCSFSISGVVYGTGRHHADLDLPDIKRAIKYWWFCFLFYALTMITSKLSVGVFLLRITVKKVHIWIIYFAMFASLLAGVLFFFVSLFQCWPISHFWEQWDPSAEGKCMKVDVIVALSYLYTVFSIASDFTFAILPAFLVWGLQLGKRTKMALIPLLAMGCMYVRLPSPHPLTLFPFFLTDKSQFANVINTVPAQQSQPAPPTSPPSTPKTSSSTPST